MPSTTVRDVRTIGVSVSNQDAAVAFFVDVLGFEKRLDVPMGESSRWIEVAPPGGTTSIALNVGEAGSDPGVDTGIRLSVPDAEAEHASMAERGVKVGDVMRWPGVPPMYTFEDPDGNRFYVVEETT